MMPLSRFRSPTSPSGHAGEARPDWNACPWMLPSRAGVRRTWSNDRGPLDIEVGRLSTLSVGRRSALRATAGQWQESRRPWAEIAVIHRTSPPPARWSLRTARGVGGNTSSAGSKGARMLTDCGLRPPHGSTAALCIPPQCSGQELSRHHEPPLRRPVVNEHASMPASGPRAPAAFAATVARTEHVHAGRRDLRIASISASGTGVSRIHQSSAPHAPCT
jgi:hypothetical protein